MYNDKVVYLEITSWCGRAVGAVHYYGRLRGDCKDKIELEKKLTKREAASQNNKWHGHFGNFKAGELTSGFPNEEQIKTVAKKVWKKHFPKAKILIEGSSSTAEPQTVLDGPRSIKEKINRLAAQAKKIDYWDKDEEQMEKLCSKWGKLMAEL